MNSNPMALMGQFQEFMKNPSQALIQRQIPKEFADDPQKAIQYLLDSGKVSQSQYNAAQQYMRQISQLQRR